MYEYRVNPSGSKSPGTWPEVPYGKTQGREDGVSVSSAAISSFGEEFHDKPPIRYSPQPQWVVSLSNDSRIKSLFGRDILDETSFLKLRIARDCYPTFLGLGILRADAYLHPRLHCHGESYYQRIPSLDGRHSTAGLLL